MLLFLGLGVSPSRSGSTTVRVRLFKEINGWADDFEALREYRSKHGHCDPDRMLTEDLQIRSWAEEQRNQYHRFLDGKTTTTTTTMTLDRIEKLTSLGFVWGAEEEDGTSLLR